MGVTERAVRSAASKGRLTVAADGTLDARTARVEWETNRKRAPGPGRPRAPADPPPADGQRKPPKKTLLELQTEHEHVKIIQRRLEIREKRGRLVDAAAVERRYFQKARRLRDGLLLWAVSAAERMAPELGCDARTLAAVLEREVRACLTSLARDEPALGEQARAVG